MKRSAIFLLILASLLVASQVWAASGYDCLVFMSPNGFVSLNLQSGNYTTFAGEYSFVYEDLYNMQESPDGKHAIYLKPESDLTDYTDPANAKATLMITSVKDTFAKQPYFSYMYLVTGNPHVVHTGLPMIIHTTGGWTEETKFFWSTDSKWFAYSWFDKQVKQQRIIIADADGSTLQNRLIGNGVIFNDLSPDGLYLSTIVGGNLIYWKMPELKPIDTDLSRSATECFVPYDPIKAYCDWWLRTDGHRVAFMQKEADGSDRLVIMTPGSRAKTVTMALPSYDPTLVKRVQNAVGPNRLLEWSPDGQYVAVASGSKVLGQDHVQLDVLRIDGTVYSKISDNVQLEEGEGETLRITWSSNHSLIFAETDGKLINYVFDTQIREDRTLDGVSTGNYFDAGSGITVKDAGNSPPLRGGITPAGLLYYVWGSRIIWMQADGSQRHQLDLNDAPTAEYWSADKQWLLIVSKQNALMVNLSTDVQKPIDLLIKYVVQAPDTQHILLTANDDSLYVINWGSDQLHKLEGMLPSLTDKSILIAPDKQKVLFTLGNQLYLFTWGSDQLREIEPNTPKLIDKLSWSPDSSVFSFVNTINGSRTLEVISAAGDTVRHFDNFPEADQIAWTQCALLN